MVELSRIYDELRDAELPLAANALNTVVGRGEHDAAVMIVGEAPGADEDREGKPFVGRSGTVLEDALGEAGLNSVFITNVVKHRPPENRDPYIDEIKAYTPFLHDEIEAVDPDVIVSLGNTATEFFFGDEQVFSGISQERGTSFVATVNGDERAVFPTYHPAATLYDGSLTETFVDDFRAVSDLVE